MKFRLYGLALLGALSLAACSDDDDDSNEPGAAQGRVRAVHLSPDAPNVDILVDGTQVLSDVPYGTVSDYLPVEAGQRTFRVEAVGSNTAAIEATVPVAEDIDYTLLAVNTLANIEPLYLTDDNSAPTAGNAKVRVVHGAPNVANVDVYVNGEPALTNVPFKQFSDYLEVPAGTYTITVTPTGQPASIAIQQDVTVTAGLVATVIAREAQGGGSPSLQVLVDNE